jgi:hypothetical protein
MTEWLMIVFDASNPAIVAAVSRGDPDPWAPLQPFTRDAIAKMGVIGTVLRGQRRSCESR